MRRVVTCRYSRGGVAGAGRGGAGLGWAGVRFPPTEGLIFFRNNPEVPNQPKLD